MNKKVLIALAIVVVAAVVVIAFVDYPPGDNKKAAGTIGKVEKYRKVNIQGSDIELRTEFIEDQDKLVKAVSSLIDYYALTVKLDNILASIDYETLCPAIEASDPEVCQKLKGLEKFVSANNLKIQSAINTLGAAYKNENPPKSDIENQIITFADFHFQLLKRNDAINEAIEALDNTLEKNPENAEKLAELRDFLMFVNWDMAARIGDEENFEFVFARNMIDPQRLIKEVDGKYVLENSKPVPDLTPGLDEIFVSRKLADVISEDPDSARTAIKKAFPGIGGEFNFKCACENEKVDFDENKINVILVSDELSFLCFEGGLQSVLDAGLDASLEGQFLDAADFLESDLGVVFVSPLTVVLGSWSCLESVMAEENLGVYLSQEDLQILADGGTFGAINFFAQDDLGVFGAIVFASEDLGIF